jgi:hypothetical protein
MRLYTVFILLSIAGYGQDGIRQKSIDLFKTSLCSCLEKTFGSYSSENFHLVLNRCATNFINENQEQLLTLASQMPDSLSDFQRGQILGLEVMKEGASVLIKDCSILTNELIKFKEAKMTWLMITKENVRAKVSSAQSRMSEVGEPNKRGALYYVFGIMHELDENFEEAQNAYAKSIEEYPSLIVILLQAQLNQNKN